MENPQAVQLTQEELSNLMSAAVGQMIQKLGLDKVDRKHAIFPGSPEGIETVTTKEERIKIFLRAIITKKPQFVEKLQAAYAVVQGETAFTKALSEGTDADGGYLVPEEFRTDVIRQAELFGMVRQRAFWFPTGSDAVNLTSAANVVTVAWINELAQITHSQPTFGRPTISVKKLAGITSLSNELFADSKFPLMGYLAELFGEAMAGEEDNQGLVGSGSPYTGLLNDTSATITTPAAGNSTFTLCTTPDNLLTVIFSLAEKYRPGSVFVMHPTVLAILLKNKASTAGTYLVGDPNSPIPMQLWGYPILTSEKMPSTTGVSTKYIIFGNIRRHLYCADRQGMALAIGTEGTVNSVNLFEKDATALRVIERIGMTTVMSAGIGVLKTSAT